MGEVERTRVGIGHNPAVFGAMVAQVYLGAMKALRWDCTAEELIAELIAQPALFGMLQAPSLPELRSRRNCMETCQEHPAVSSLSCSLTSRGSGHASAD